MRQVALTVAALLALGPVAAAAQGSSGSSKHESMSKEMQSDPMAGWTPPKVTREAQGRKEIHQLFVKMEKAAHSGDLKTAVGLIDFPVMMITDNKAGEAMGEPWTQEQWEKVMAPFYEKPMKDAKMTHNPTIFFLSDSLASVDDQWTMTAGGKKMSGRSSSIVIRTGGEWKVKAMVEGGWGDMPMPESGSNVAGSSSGMGSTSGTGSTSDTESGSGSTSGTGSTGESGSTGSTGTGSTETGESGGSGTTGTQGSTPQPGGGAY